MLFLFLRAGLRVVVVCDGLVMSRHLLLGDKRGVREHDRVTQTL